MNARFCIHCGTPITNLSPASPVLTCPSCGKSFANPFVAKQRQGGSSGAPIWVLAIVAVPFVVAVIGILAAIAIPNFIRYQQKSKQAECKVVLREIATAQGAAFAVNARYSNDVASLSLSPPTKHRYAYLVGPAPEGVLPPDRQFDTFRLDDVESLADGERARGDAESFTALCAGQLDSDPSLDVWSISNKERVIRGMTAPANEPWHHFEDMFDEPATDHVR